ncbi:MAG: hypothetical protein GPJ54_19930 [Candidatus Heimdallarchaeota archaeon]|nr:hypothetical protein [Candidatus Heimdallarchaeota archaeon]
MTSNNEIDKNDKLLLDEIRDYYDLNLQYVDELNIFSDDIDYYWSGMRVVLLNNRVGRLSISYTRNDLIYSEAKDLKLLFKMIYGLSALTHLQLFIENYVFEEKVKRHEEEWIPIPSGINKLQLLRSLSIYRSNFSHLPDDIGELRELKYLNLARTNIVTLPKSFFELRDLNILITAHSKISNSYLKEIKMKMSYIEYIVSDDYGPFWNDHDFDMT